jgi:hypothetical protein
LARRRPRTAFGHRVRRLGPTIAAAFGDISEFLRVHDYGTYATKNIEVYTTIMGSAASGSVVALSSGFMTYGEDVHPSKSFMNIEWAAPLMPGVRQHLVESKISVLTLRQFWHKKRMNMLMFLEEVSS